MNSKNKLSKTRIIAFSLVALSTTLTSCADGPYGNYPNSPNTGYGYPSQNYPQPNNYPGQYYPPNQGYPNQGYPNQGYGYPPQQQAPYYPPPQRNDNRQAPPPPPPVVQPPAPPAQPVIRPSCPSGSSFDGRSCNITDNRLKRPGGDGRINPCPSGMRVSGDRCI